MERRIRERVLYNFKKYKKQELNQVSQKNGNRIDMLIVNRKNKKLVNKKKYSVGDVDNVIFAELDDKIINKFHPDNIDSCYFWKKATEFFPFSSIVFSGTCKSKKELNDESINNIHQPCGALGLLEDVLKQNPDAKILEIGPGYGRITGVIACDYFLENYYAIDVNPLFNYKKLYKTDGKTIPPEIPDELDVVYSVNVFQHLSQSQRLSYYEQISKKLKCGGKFIFSNFIVSEETLRMVIEHPNGKFHSIFQMRDMQGNSYVSFFGQFTKCDKLEDIMETFENLGMSLKIENQTRNHFTFCATKK